MFDPTLLENVRYVIDSKGKKAAVQVDVKAWDALLAYLEDLEVSSQSRNVPLTFPQISSITLPNI